MVGKMMSVCLIHGGVAAQFLSRRLYDRVCGRPTEPPTISDVLDEDIRSRLERVRTCI